MKLDFAELDFKKTGYPLIFIHGNPLMRVDGYPSMIFIDGYPSMNINGSSGLTLGPHAAGGADDLIRPHGAADHIGPMGHGASPLPVVKLCN